MIAILAVFNDVCAKHENERVIPRPNQTFDYRYVYFFCVFQTN